MHLEAWHALRDGGHDHVETTFPQLIHKLVVLALKERNGYVRVRALVHGNGARHDDVAARGRYTHANPAPVVVRDVAELLAHGTLLGLEAPRVGEKLLARVGERKRDGAFDELHPKLALGGGNACREGLLAHVHESSGTREAAFLGNGNKVVHGLEVHGSASLIAIHARGSPAAVRFSS